MELADNVAAAARTFLDGLDDEQARDVLLPFDEEERRAWAYWPTERRGIPLWRLDRGQIKAAHRLVATLLAVPAYARIVTIMGLDEVLDRMEAYASDRRHGEDYWVSIFALPGREVWGVRFEGHHISVHATFSRGEARLTPLFLGANPAVVHDDGLRRWPHSVPRSSWASSSCTPSQPMTGRRRWSLRNRPTTSSPATRPASTAQSRPRVCR